jgi:hypothetical protein
MAQSEGLDKRENGEEDFEKKVSAKRILSYNERRNPPARRNGLDQ